MSVDLAQVIINSIIKIEVNARLLLKGTVLWVPCKASFQLYLEFFITYTMDYKRYGVCWAKL